MLDLPDHLRDHAKALASALTPRDINRLTSVFNRSTRRKLTAKARKGQLKPSDLPTWFIVLTFLTGAVHA